MNDLEIIKQIEKILNVKLEKLKEVQWNSSGYEINQSGQVLALGLSSCNIDNGKLTHISFLLKALKGLKKLILTDNEVSDIFPLSDFISLSELNLSGNQISDISSLKDLTNLTKLTLSKNQIKDIYILKDLKALNDLELDENQIKDVSSLKDLTNLTNLVLSVNQINDIYSIKDLKSLTCLDLWKNQIKDISPLKDLNDLDRLYLSENKIIDVSSLRNLKKLKDLDLSENQIKNISPLMDLKSVTNLELYGNQIYCISSLKELQGLTYLDLAGNQIKDISSLKNLKSLNYLILRENQIKDISYLKDLKCLTNIDLSSNHIEQLPEWITEFNSEIVYKDIKRGYSDFINFYDNPLKSPPVEIVKQGKEAIKAYFDSIEEEVLLYETKLVIVGRGFAGKTVLAKKLLDINFKLPEKEDTTKGVTVIKKPLIHYIPELDVDFKFHLWDFGGQEKYDATHQFFITENSLYLFVTEARQESNYLDFDFWLNTIDLFANDSPVIVVMSKIDDRKKDLPETTFKDKYKNIFEFAKVSCADGKEDTITSLKNLIGETTIAKLKLVKFPSQKWKNVPNKLEQLSKGKNYITYNEYLELCGAFGVSEMKAEVLSKYLHDLGFIIYRKDDLLLSKMVIINIDWCVDGAYKVLDNDKLAKQNGYFTDNDLKEIWNEEKYKDKQQELLNLMKKYKLCFELRDKTGYIAPNLLPEDKPIGITWDYTDNLFFEYRYKFMPAGLLTRFIVEGHAFIKGVSYWKFGVELEFENTTALIIEDYIGRKITIAITGQNKKGLLNTIRMLFSEVHKDIKALVPIEMVPCNCIECKKSEAPYFYEYNILNKFLSKGVNTDRCKNSIEEVNIQTLIDDILPRPLQEIISDKDLQYFVFKLFSNIEHNINCKQGYSYLWRDKECIKEPKFETETHPYICNLLEAGSESRGIQLSREVKEGNGNVDVFFSYTNRENKIAKTCIEIKKAEHTDVETAVGTQLKAYLDGMQSKHGIYLVLWFKNENYNCPNYASPDELEKAIVSNIPKGYSIKVKVIDCNKPKSPSTL